MQVWYRRIILLLVAFVSLVVALAWVRPDFRMAVLLAGAARILGMVAVTLFGLGFLLMPVAVLLIRAVLPAEPRLDDIEEADPPEEFDRQARAAGFLPARPPAEVNTRPPTRMWAYLHRRLPVVAAAVRVRDRVSTGLLSRLEGGTLETIRDADLDRIPIPPWIVRQVIPDTPLAGLLAHHERALALLARHGRPAQALRPQDVDALVLGTFAAARAYYGARPVWCGVRLWLRTVLLWSPNLVPLAEREEDALARAIAGREP